MNTIRMSNSLDPDQGRPYAGPEWVHTVFKGHQQAAKVGTCRERVEATNTVPKHFSFSGADLYNFEKNRAFYDKSMKLGTWLVDNNAKKLRVSATPKMSSNGRHLVFSKMAAFLNLFIIMSFLICKDHVFFS